MNSMWPARSASGIRLAERIGHGSSASPKSSTVDGNYPSRGGGSSGAVGRDVRDAGLAATDPDGAGRVTATAGGPGGTLAGTTDSATMSCGPRHFDRNVGITHTTFGVVAFSTDRGGETREPRSDLARRSPKRERGRRS